MKHISQAFLTLFIFANISIALLIFCVVIEASKEKAPHEYADELMDDRVELDFHGNDMKELFKKVGESLCYDEEGWFLSRVDVRLINNSKEGVDYNNVYLYYKPNDGAEEIYRQVRVLKKNDRWYVVDAIQQNHKYEPVSMDEYISEAMLSKIWGLAEEQALLYLSDNDECNVSVKSKEVNFIVFKEKDGYGKCTIDRVAFLIREFEDGYQLDEIN